MTTECHQQAFDFQPLGRREVTARFDGGTIASNVNQLRRWLSNVACEMQQTPREHGLQETPLATARCDTMRLKLLKI